MGEIVILGIGFDRPAVTLPMSATKEEIVGAILAEDDAIALAEEFRAERESAEREDRGNQ